MANHHALVGHEAAVATALTQPYRITYDAIYENRECFYRPRIHSRYPDQFLKVCVEFEANDFGMVVTAFLTPNLRVGEVQRWPRAKTNK